MMKALLKGLLIVLGLGIVLAGCGSENGSGGGGTMSTPPGPLGAPPCQEAGQRACNNHSTLYAVAHSYTDPEHTVLYRVEVGAWDLGTGWQGSRNGLFYRATVSGDASICVNPQGSTSCSSTKVFVPFNGVSFDGSAQEPELPAFSFIVPVTGGTSSTAVTVEACFTNYKGSSFDAEPPCTVLGWSDVYSSLPTPTVGLPTGFKGTTVAELVDTTTASIPNTGVYPGVLLVRPSETLDDTGLDFFYDHLVFLDQNGNPYTNDIFDGSSSERRSMGVLPIDEAAYPVSGTEYLTKYGNMQKLQGVALPDKQFFFYTADEISSTAIKVGITYLYDGASGCLGDIPGVGSNDPSCAVFLSAAAGVGSGLPSFGTAASITPVSNEGSQIQPTQQSGLTAGEREHRTVTFQSAGGGLCPRVVNPLATALGSGRYGMPNYVIRRTIDDTRSWGRDFPNAMYFVLPTAFGNCSISDAPFCQRTTGTTSYDAYVPHYLNTSNTSTETLNGGSTSSAVVGGLTLADEYTLGNTGQASENSLVYFDNCGYGYLYSEGGDSGVALGTRKTLPSAPNNGDTYTYQISNDLDRPVVFGKECCATDYQENMDEFGNTYLEPPVELDNGFGVFVGAGNTVTYRTLFNDEAIVIYDATTGERLVKLRLNEGGGALYSCNDSSLAVQVSTTSSKTLFDVGIGSDTGGSLKCRAIGECPFGTQAGLSEGNISCTLSTSSFLIGLPDWAKELSSSAVPIQLRAWGGDGEDNQGDKGVGGLGGVAATAESSDQLSETLFAYVGKRGPGNGGKGGSSTILINGPLDLVAEPENITDPSTIGVLLIAGGGGGAGTGFLTSMSSVNPGEPGGDGGVAIASTSAAASAAGQMANSVGGQGGNQDQLGSGAGAGSNGVGGHGGDGVDWSSDGSLILPKSWSAGKGADSSSGSAGGGGFGGGQHGQNSDFGGGGGGGSWAAGATVAAALPNSNTPPLSPNGSDGAVQLLYSDADTNGTANCITQTEGNGRVDGICTLTAGSKFNLADFPAFVGAGADSIMWIQAWGGRGGRGQGVGEEGVGTASGGDHGPSGFAQTVTTVSDYQKKFGTTSIHVYLGGQDTSGHNAGKGGAATIVSTADLTTQTPAMGNLVLIAGGGGGGGHAQSTVNGKKGGAGGVAIATTSTNAAGCGESGGSSGNSGGHGKGGCNGAGGDGGGSNSSHNGHDGIGGYGGSVHAGGSQTTPQGWTNETPTKVGDNGGGGNGGNGNGGVGGGGGGGFGGGGGGNGGGTGESGGGGGGGGSFAVRSTLSDSRAPTSQPDPPSNDGVVRIVFPDLP